MQDKGPPSELMTEETVGFVGQDKSTVSSGKRKSKLGIFLIVAALVVIVDQLSKLWIRTHFTLGESLSVTDRLSLTYFRNPGAAFGLLANQTFLLIVIGIASLFVILLLFRYLSPVTTLSRVVIGLIWGGALGNLIDRLRFGYVTDFIDFRLWGGFHWPTFNIADAAITLGVIALIYHFFRWEILGKKHEHQLKPQD